MTYLYPEEVELRVNIAQGQILQSFNYLEYNLGLSVNYWHGWKVRHGYSPEKIELGMMRQIKWLLNFVKGEGKMDAYTDFNKWSQSAEKARFWRNFYIHGIWRLESHGYEFKVRFILPDWRPENIKGENTRCLAITELEADSSYVKSVYDEFNKLRTKHNV